MNKTIDALVACPFYLREKDRTLSCEGLVEGACTQTTFRTKKKKDSHIRSCCCHCSGADCAVARALYAKYRGC